MIRFARLLFAAAALAFALVLVAGCGGDEAPARPGEPLPKDFPTAQVPMVDGRVLSAAGDRSSGWSITIQGSAGTTNPLDAAVTKLTDAGYQQSQRTTEGNQVIAVLSHKVDKDTYWVSVGTTAGAAGGAASIFYSVNVN